MLLRLVVITPLVASLGLAPSRGAGARRAQSAPAQAGAQRCVLKPAQPPPAIAGFHFGMTFGEAAARFPQFPQLARFAPGDKELDLRDASGERVISARNDDPGVVSVVVHGRHAGGPARPAAGDVMPEEFTTIGMVYLDGRLGLIGVNGWRSPRWKEIYEFRERAAEQFGFAGAQWNVLRPSLKPAPGTYPDFQSDRHELDCDGFKVTASCVGPPGPPDVCDLTIWDTEAAKAIVARGRGEAGAKKAVGPKRTRRRP